MSKTFTESRVCRVPTRCITQRKVSVTSLTNADQITRGHRELCSNVMAGSCILNERRSRSVKSLVPACRNMLHFELLSPDVYTHSCVTWAITPRFRMVFDIWSMHTCPWVNTQLTDILYFMGEMSSVVVTRPRCVNEWRTHTCHQSIDLSVRGIHLRCDRFSR